MTLKFHCLTLDRRFHICLRTSWHSLYCLNGGTPLLSLWVKNWKRGRSGWGSQMRLKMRHKKQRICWVTISTHDHIFTLIILEGLMDELPVETNLPTTLSTDLPARTNFSPPPHAHLTPQHLNKNTFISDLNLTGKLHFNYLITWSIIPVSNSRR